MLIFTLFIVLYAVLIIIYIIGWYRKPVMKSIEMDQNEKPIHFTIIIPARNESQNIEACLSSVIQNQYPPQAYEILLVDDFSEDDTAVKALQLFQKTGFTSGKVISLSDHIGKEERVNSFKKKALEIAISQASGDYVVTTDADCIVPENWLKNISCTIQKDDALFVIAPVSFIPFRKKNILYYFQSLDFMTMQGITTANAALNIGSMCNGANMAFHKDTFYALGGYMGINKLASGDDMMLLNKFRKNFPKKISYLKAKDAIVLTPVQDSWKSFLNQRIRWASKSGKYRDDIITMQLVLVYLFNLHFIVLGVVAFFNLVFLKWLLLVLLLKIIIELVYLLTVANFYGKKSELLIFPLLQPLHIIYIVSTGFLGFFGKYQWKGRTVK